MPRFGVVAELTGRRLAAGRRAQVPPLEHVCHLSEQVLKLLQLARAHAADEFLVEVVKDARAGVGFVPSALGEADQGGPPVPGVGAAFHVAVLFEMLGSKYARCGSTDYLQFDHIDPASKRFAIGAGLSRAWADLVEETSRCQLLCMICHREKGAEDRPEVPHSYYRYWYWGCRCDVCRAANTRKGAALRAKKLEKDSINRGFRRLRPQTTEGLSAFPLLRSPYSSRAKTRTWNLPVNSRLLCQLSYAGPSRHQPGREAGTSRTAAIAVTRLAHPGGPASHARDPPRISSGGLGMTKGSPCPAGPAAARPPAGRADITRSGRDG
jgi:hypothetical protein